MKMKIVCWSILWLGTNAVEQTMERLESSFEENVWEGCQTKLSKWARILPEGGPVWCGSVWPGLQKEMCPEDCEHEQHCLKLEQEWVKFVCLGCRPIAANFGSKLNFKC